MQVQFVRGTGTTGMIRSRPIFTLAVTLQLTDAERDLLTKYGWLNVYIETATGADLDGDHPMRNKTLDQFVRGVTLEAEKASPLVECENLLIRAAEEALQTCGLYETFSGRTQVFEISADGHKLVA